MENIYETVLNDIEHQTRFALVSEYKDNNITKSIVYADDYDKLDGGFNADETLCFAEKTEHYKLLEFYAAKSRLIILGGGHIALPLTAFGSELGFDITVFDDRPAFANAGRFPGAKEVICDDFNHTAERLCFSRDDYVVIVTRGHKHDTLCLQEILRGQWPRYVGMIGSKRRIAIVKSQFTEMYHDKKLSKLHAPIGLSIGAVTPEEISISILSEIISTKRLGEKRLNTSNTDMKIIKWLAEESTGNYHIATIVAADGSTPREIGSKMIILPHGKVIGSIGGGCAESEVIRQALSNRSDIKYALLQIDLADSAEDEGMVCGGKMKVLLEKAN